MPNRINQLLLKEYKSRFGSSDVISVGYPGLKIENTNVLRAKLEEKGIDLLFVKNRIANIAFKELGRPEISRICDGQTAFAISEDPVSMARFFVDYAKEHKEMKIHGAVVEDTVLDGEGVKSLSQSATKEELKSKIVGQALGPGSRISGAAKGPGGMIAGQIKSLIEKLEGGDAA